MFAISIVGAGAVRRQPSFDERDRRRIVLGPPHPCEKTAITGHGEVLHESALLIGRSAGHDPRADPGFQIGPGEVRQFFLRFFHGFLHRSKSALPARAFVCYTYKVAVAGDDWKMQNAM